MQQIPHSRGFTLVELMITLVVAAILIAIAAPSMGQFIRENRAATQANNVLASIQLARAEAINRNLQVTMRRSSNTNGVWHEGWQIFTDWDGDGIFDGDINDRDCSIEDQDCLLFIQQALPATVSLTTGANYATGLAFLPSGEIRRIGGALGNDTFALCIPNAFEREIIVSPGGRPRIEVGTEECP